MLTRNMHSQRGVSLVELMVGLVVGLLVTVAAMGSASFFMAMQKQSSAAGTLTGDAQLAGEAIRQDIEQAGLGLYSKSGILCESITTGEGRTLPLNAVTVGEENGNASIEVAYAPSVQSAAEGKTASALLNGVVTLVSRTLANEGDTVILANSSKECGLFKVVSITPGLDALGPTLTLTGPSSVVLEAGATFMPVRSLIWRKYSVEDGVLSVAEPLSNARVDLTRNVVGFKAVTGHVSASSNGTPSQWRTDEITSQDSSLRLIRFGIALKSDYKARAAGGCDQTTVQPRLLEQSLSLGENWECYKFRAAEFITAPFNTFLSAK